VAFLKVYLPLKAGLGLDVAASQASIGDGPIVPMKNLVPIYSVAGGIIDLIVLLAFALAGAVWWSVSSGHSEKNHNHVSPTRLFSPHVPPVPDRPVVKNPDLRMVPAG
jgi:hypothetical protein